MNLVANADDAGVDDPRNQGILRAARCGSVRSASLLAGFPAASSFVVDCRAVPALSVGLHFNITEGLPLVAGHRTLTGSDGRFLGKREAFRRALAGLLDEREVVRELEAQWLLAEMLLGQAPSHVDGHNHAHLFPGAAEALAGFLPERTWTRGVLPRPGCAAPPPAAESDPYACPAGLRAALESLTKRALDVGWRRFRLADRLEGLDLLESSSLEDYLRIIDSIPTGAGVVELMTHPGLCSTSSVPFSAAPGRERELATLCDPRLAERCRARGVDIKGFGDLS